MSADWEKNFFEKFPFLMDHSNVYDKSCPKLPRRIQNQSNCNGKNIIVCLFWKCSSICNMMDIPFLSFFFFERPADCILNIMYPCVNLFYEHIQFQYKLLCTLHVGISVHLSFRSFTMKMRWLKIQQKSEKRRNFKFWKC